MFFKQYDQTVLHFTFYFGNFACHAHRDKRSSIGILIDGLEAVHLFKQDFMDLSFESFSMAEK